MMRKNLRIGRPPRSAYNFFSATMASTSGTYRLGAVASIKFLTTENKPRQLRIVDWVGGCSWQSYRIIIIATRLARLIARCLVAHSNMSDQLAFSCVFGAPCTCASRMIACLWASTFYCSLAREVVQPSSS